MSRSTLSERALASLPKGYSPEEYANAVEREVERDPEAVRLLCADQIKTQPIRWLWRGWLARGKLHILAGSPGTGKTTIALSLAAAITRGGMLPDGSRPVPGGVLVWSGEDDPADTIVPRLKAAGADLSRVHIIGDVGHGEDARPFDPARDLPGLERAALEIGDIGLLIADPVVSAVAGDSHKNTEVRRALQPMVHLATRLDCAVLGISHFSKGTAGRDPVERVTGSIAFGALARVVMVTAKGEDDARLLARAKSNIGPDGGGFGYTLELVDFDGEDVSKVAWGAPLEGSARELLGDAEMVGDSPRDDAAEWLDAMLAGAEVPVAEIKKQATAAGFSWRTVERAKSEMSVIAEAVGRQGGGVVWHWRLKSATAKTATPTTKVGGLSEPLPHKGFQADLDQRPPNGEVGGLCPEGVIL